jgi:uncharacterized membrane protein
MSNQVRSVLRVVLALLMISAGCLHFVAERFFVQIVPPQLPWPQVIVWISGVCEIALGALLLPSATRRWAGLGLVALFVAIFPANLYMALDNVQLRDMPGWYKQPSQLALWLRLPFQLVLIAWALWVSATPRGAVQAGSDRTQGFR